MKVKQMQEEFPLSYGQRMRQARIVPDAEELDYTPLAIPFDCKKPESLSDMINRILAVKFSESNEEYESLDEADDFDCDDDEFPDPESPYEEVFDPDGNSLGFHEQNARDMERQKRADEAAAAAAKETAATEGGSRPKRSKKAPQTIDDAIDDDDDE